MPHFHVLRVLVFISASIAFATSAGAGRGPIGVWFNDTGQGAVEIYRCGARLCGKIVWLDQPISRRTGRPLQDAYNPSERLRTRPICGLQVIRGLRMQSDGSWDGGRIYDPKVGKSYDVALTQLSRNRLQITGYIGMRLFGKNLIWQRAPDDLARCGTPAG